MHEDDNRGGQQPQWDEGQPAQQEPRDPLAPRADAPKVEPIPEQVEPQAPAPHSQPASQPPQQASQQQEQPRMVPPDDDGTVVVDGNVWRPAGFGWRMGAFLIDWVILSVFSALLLELIGYKGPDEVELANMLSALMSQVMTLQEPSQDLMNRLMEIQQGVRIVGWFNVLLCMSYYTIFHSVAGATLGKLCLGLQVMTNRGHKLSYGNAFVRYLFRFLLSRFFFGGAFTVWFDPRRRTAYDMIAGTNVFRQVPREQLERVD
ncbi:MAG: RDD family protein [Planctomycetales bacterium]|nr:RDD family protein [bacterium]UNM08353.1 MAG: RDD family protein [Planctomycetales bacterium]